MQHRLCRNASAHEARTVQPRAQTRYCCAVRKKGQGGIDYVALHIDREMGHGWRGLGSSFQRDLGTIPAEALTSNKKSKHAKGPSIFWKRKTVFSSACIAQDASWLEPLSANSFPPSNYPEREHEETANWLPFFLVSPRRRSIGRKPQLMNNLLLRMVVRALESPAVRSPKRNPKNFQ
jgi:hypothetical protein